MATLRPNGTLNYLGGTSVESDNYFYSELHYLTSDDESYGGYTVPDNRILENLDRNGQRNFWRNDTLVEVYGKVIYERVTSYTTGTVKGSDAKMPAYETVNYANVELNWKIESQMPPTGVYPPGSSTYASWWTELIDEGFVGYYNAPITNVTIRIRKLKGQRTADGGIQSSNPFAPNEYDEVGKIVIDAKRLNSPPDSTLNDTNRGYHPSDRPHLLNKTLTSQLKGYSDEKIQIDTLTGKVTYLKKTDETEDLTITWNAGYNKFDPDSYYYLTLEPENHPEKRSRANAGSTNPMLIPSDGWFGIQKIYPYHNNRTQFTNGFDGVQGNQDSWFFGNRFTPGDPESGGWTRLSNNLLKNPSDILAKLKSTTLYWSDNDKNIPAEEFHMYGYNIRNHADQKLTTGSLDVNKFTKRDKIDAKAEYFAWFKTPVIGKVLGPITFVNNATKGTERRPIVDRDKEPDLANTADPLKKTVTVYGKFYYETLDFYLESEFINQYNAAIAANQPENAAKIKAEIDKLKNTLKRPSDKPKTAGFVFIDKKNNKIYKFTALTGLDTISFDKYLRDMPDDVGYAIADVEMYFRYTPTIEIGLLDTWVYQVWVERVDGTIWYAHPTMIEAQATDYPIFFGSPTYTSFPQPSVSSKGFWYQVYPCWKLVEQDTVRTQIPYITRDQNIAAADIFTKEKLIPVHYYMNYTFTTNTNYQFRTTVENYIHGKKTNTPDAEADSNNAVQSNLHIMLPWSENLKVETPYINTHIDSLSQGDRIAVNNINLYLYANINGYTLENTKRLNQDFTLKDYVTKPRTFFMSKHNPQNPITYTANMKFTPGLSYVGVAKSEWIIQGFATFDILNQVNIGMANTAKGSQTVPYFINDEPISGKGWHWLEKENTFVWFDKIAPANNNCLVDVNKNLPVGGNVYDFFSNKKPDIQYLLNNFIAKFIIFQSFNLAFDYLNNSDFGLSMYVGRKLPYIKSANEWYFTNIDELIENGDLTLVGKLGRSTNGTTQKCEFYGINGNQYIIFVADPVIRFNKLSSVSGTSVPEYSNFGTTTLTDRTFRPPQSGFILTNGKKGFGTYSVIRLSNFVTTTNYHDENNLVHDVSFTTFDPIPAITNASYSITLGSGNNVFQDGASLTKRYTAKAGNASFNAGIWENGVWNNGWREDLTRCEFYKVLEYYSYNKDRVWRVKIFGPKTSTSNFQIGDRVSVGNVVAIDINEKRKLLKKFYFILDVTEDYVEIEVFTEFPVKRIEKDSSEHRIWISKNVWLNGVFLNGYFNGIWNFGIFSGYPKITKMDESNWIDGTFNGGHFTANKYSFEFNGAYLMNYENIPRLAITTLQPHRLTTDDIISITYSYAGSIEYLGTTTVLSVPSETEIITGVFWDDDFAKIQVGGRILSVISTGLIQNFNFHSKNVSKITSLDTMISESVFSYDSWIDVNYSDQAAVNIGRIQTNTEPYSKRLYPENNLYGYPTNDVLSSYSVFRDSFSLASRKYRLGSRFKVYSDYVGNASSFEDYFDSSDTVKGLKQFNSQGWSFKVPETTIEINVASQSYMPGPNSTKQLVLYSTDEFADRINQNDIIRFVGPELKGNVYVNSTRSTKVNSRSTIGSSLRFITNNYEGTWDITGNFKISITASNNMTFSRTPEPITTDTPIQGKELKINAYGTGGILDLIPSYDVPNRVNGQEFITTEANRYTMVEFDLVDYLSGTNSTTIEKYGGISHTPLHFNNLNYVRRELTNENGIQVESQIEASYLPVYKNVNHLTTFGKRKQEFFFNKRNLMMNVHGVGSYGVDGLELYVDNLKFYEVDMIPFFQYFKDPSEGQGNINISIQAPNEGISPDINLSDEEIVDTETPNEIMSYFTDRLISGNIQVPLNINWQDDYAIYRTQIQDIDDPNSLYES